MDAGRNASPPMERHVSKHRAVRRHRSSSLRRQQSFVAAAIFAAVTGTVVMASETDAWAADSGVSWDSIASCEAGGNWHIVDKTGTYLGGLQFTLSTWHANGGTGNPANASRETQIAVAERILATQGIARGLQNWPVCGKRAWSGAPAARHAATPSVPKQSPQNGTYTVVSGDALGSIAAKLGLSGGWKALHAANSSTVSDPSLIFPGQQLRLP
jgi:resuscitation-promoting factor RpfA